MLSPTERFRENLRASTQIKLEPEMWFSPGLAAFIRHIASYEQLHPDAMCICVLNVVSICCSNSFIHRRGNSYVPLNLYNFVIGKSGYGKSDILCRVERAVKECVKFHVEKFLTASSRQAIKSLGDCEETSKTVPRVIFNDGTGAGILSQLDSCTRAFCLHEADTTMNSWNVLQSSPLDRTINRVDSFRSTLMTLYEDPGSFTRLLKKELINTEGSKLILLGASTGELIISQLGRIAGHQMADALFERITLFPLEGDPIANEDCLLEIDFTRYPSLEQFGMICGFLSNVKLKLDDNGDIDVARLTLEMKKSSSLESSNDPLASRLAKTSQVIYRFAGFFCLLECAMEIAEKYLSEYGSFGNGQCNLQFFNRCQSIVQDMYGFIFMDGNIHHLIVHESIASRARDVALANLEQYRLLLFVDKDDGRHWNVLPGGQTRLFSSVPFNGARTSTAPSDDRFDQWEKPKRRILNLWKKSNPLKVNILLHDSIIFVKSGLYIDWKLKSASSIIDKSLLPELIDEGLLISINNGILGKFNKPTVFIKTVPGGNMSTEDLERLLSLYGDDRLTVETYLDKCKKVKIEGCGQVSGEVFRVLNRPEYQLLRLDLSSLINLKPSTKIPVKLSTTSSSIIIAEAIDQGSDADQTSNEIMSTPLPNESISQAGNSSNEQAGSAPDRNVATTALNHHHEMVTNSDDGMEHDHSVRSSVTVLPRTTADLTDDMSRVEASNQKRKSENCQMRRKKSKSSDGSTGDCSNMEENQFIYRDLIGANLRPRRSNISYR